MIGKSLYVALPVKFMVASSAIAKTGDLPDTGNGFARHLLEPAHG